MRSTKARSSESRSIELDGVLKVTGKARYAYEYHEEVPNAAYGWVVTSGIAKGRIKAFDLSACERAPGVLLVYTYLNVPHTKPRVARPGRSNLISQLSGPLIEHHGQAVAFVVAETLGTGSCSGSPGKDQL